MPLLAQMEVDGQVVFLALIMFIAFVRWLGTIIGKRVERMQATKQAEEERFRPPRPRPKIEEELEVETGSTLQDFLEEMAGIPKEPEPEPEIQRPVPPPPPPLTEPSYGVEPRVAPPRPAPPRRAPKPSGSEALAVKAIEARKEAQAQERAERIRQLRRMISSPEGLRTAWVASEVLGRPRAWEEPDQG